MLLPSESTEDEVMVRMHVEHSLIKIASSYDFEFSKVVQQLLSVTSNQNFFRHSVEPVGRIRNLNPKDISVLSNFLGVVSDVIVSRSHHCCKKRFHLA